MRVLTAVESRMCSVPSSSCVALTRVIFFTQGQCCSLLWHQRVATESRFAKGQKGTNAMKPSLRAIRAFTAASERATLTSSITVETFLSHPLI